MSEDARLTKEELKLLQKQFPSLQADIIHSVAEACNFNAQLTTSNLRDMTGDYQGGVRRKQRQVVESDQVRILNFIREGWKIVVLMRGLPGSGKTLLAHEIIKKSDVNIPPSILILSTDDYFKRNGSYDYDSKQLQTAHTWNQERCFTTMQNGVSPIIIDNTNLAKWEMETYCVMAVEFGYMIEILEPETRWSRDPKVLAQKNSHNVPKEKIVRMLNNYDREVTVTSLFQQFRLKYTQDVPQKRTFPPLMTALYPSLSEYQNTMPHPDFSSYNNFARRLDENFTFMSNNNVNSLDLSFDKKPQILEYVHKFDDQLTEDTTNKDDKEENDKMHIDKPEELNAAKSNEIDKTSNETVKQTNKSKITSTPSIGASSETKRINESIANLIDFLDDSNTATSAPTGSHYGAFPLMPTQASIKSDSDSDIEMKKPKTNDVQSKYSVESVTSSSHLNAWGTDEKALQSWETVVPLKTKPSTISVDFEIFKKIDEASNRSRTQLSDKMTNTNSEDFKYAQNCGAANGTSILRTESRQINTVGVPIKSLPPRRKITVDVGCMTKETEGEEVKDYMKQLTDVFPNIPIEYMLDVYEKCHKDLNWTMDLLSESDFVPSLSANQSKGDRAIRRTVEEANTTADVSMINSWEVLDVKGLNTSRNEVEKFKQQQDILDLKKKLEQNVNFGKEHYSPHVWGLINQRHGTSKTADESSFEEVPSNIEYDSDPAEEDENNTVQVSLGDELVKQLEKIVGNEDFVNKKFHTAIQIPVSLAKQLHALYLQSVCHQIEEQSELFNKDEAYAQQLDTEEREAVKGPDFSAIMDEQLAQFYQKKDLEQLKTMSPDTFAIVLKKNKLYKAFPSVANNLIDSLLQSNGYNYEYVVDTLIASVNQKFIFSEGNLRETPITDDMINEMKDNKAIVEQVSKDDDNRSAEEYRNEAMLYMQKVEHLENLVRSYHKKGWGEVAVFYSKLAEDMRHKRDLINQKATYLQLQQNTIKLMKGSDTLDLHYLTVKEAITSLDVFIDKHISELGEKKVEEFFVITGRGNRSASGKSVLRPAVIARLKKRNVGFSHMNPGLLKIKLRKELVMSTDLKK